MSQAVAASEEAPCCVRKQNAQAGKRGEVAMGLGACCCAERRLASLARKQLVGISDPWLFSFSCGSPRS